MTTRRGAADRRRRRAWRAAAIACVAASTAASIFTFGRGSAPSRQRAAAPPTSYVGAQECARCHSATTDRWRQSHHALAMRIASDSTIAGDFADARVRFGGVTTTFFRRGDQFLVRTDGPGGTMRDYEVKYTFGVAPLQQYLIALDGGRLQALGIAWDTRARADGGQRWFHLYPGQRIRHDDELHWTGIRQNWNYMCADCHSTGVKKNYNAATGQFATTFAAINVGCEACHGPGSRHVASGGRDSLPALTRANEVERCAQCHARREQFSDEYTPGRPLGDAYRVALLDEPLYFPDGQIREEVFEYGSFVQSKMYSKGVACSDCHDPHTGKLRAAGSQVCLGCHVPSKYQTTAHHFHRVGSPGADCVSCHMPTTTYMVVHPRHDHSIRVPRPDLSVALGVPNACSKCHTDRSPTWAAQRLQAWYGRTPTGYQQYAEAFAAGSHGDSSAIRLLTRVAGDGAHPAFARASALRRLASSSDAWQESTVAVTRARLSDSSSLVRYAALLAASRLEGVARERLVSPLLGDSIRMVRMEAARLLADAPQASLAEYLAAERFNGDRPEARLNLAQLYSSQGRGADAERELRAALAIEPRFVPALVNLADLYRALRRESDAERALRSAVAIDSTNAAAHHALGLLLIRVKRLAESLAELRVAARSAPDVPHYSNVYAIALREAGRTQTADEVLNGVIARHPFDRDALALLIPALLRRGDTTRALMYTRRLVAIEPANADMRTLAQELAAGRRRDP